MVLCDWEHALLNSNRRESSKKQGWEVKWLIDWFGVRYTGEESLVIGFYCNIIFKRLLMEWAVHKYSLMEGAVEQGWRVMLKNLDGCDELSWKDNNREHWRLCKARGEEKGCTNRMLKWPLTGAEDCFKTIAVHPGGRGAIVWKISYDTSWISQTRLFWYYCTSLID